MVSVGAGMGRTTLFIIYKGSSGYSEENAFGLENEKASRMSGLEAIST